MRLTKFTSNLHELDTEIQNFVKLLQGPEKETKGNHAKMGRTYER